MSGLKENEKQGKKSKGKEKRNKKKKKKKRSFYGFVLEKLKKKKIQEKIKNKSKYLRKILAPNSIHSPTMIHEK